VDIQSWLAAATSTGVQRLSAAATFFGRQIEEKRFTMLAVSAAQIQEDFWRDGHSGEYAQSDDSLRAADSMGCVLCTNFQRHFA
jgi:hypothetical protein